MLNFRFILPIFILLSLIGCTTAEIEKYVYKESNHGPEITTEETYWNEVIYKKGNYEFFPRFYSLTRSYSAPSSRLIIYSSLETEIHLKKIILESAEGTYSDEISFERVITLDNFDEERNSNFVGLPLFDQNNTNLSKYWEEGDIRVTLSYADNSDKNEVIIFEFKLWKGREVVWPT